jgi:hypothetical protein
MIYTYWNLTGRIEEKHENDPSVQSAFAVTKMSIHENKLERVTFSAHLLVLGRLRFGIHNEGDIF